jgi:hypothetical protein
MMSKKHKRQVPRTASFNPAVGRVEFNPDYTTTKRELRRIGILAASFFAILIVLSFFQDKLLALFLK